MHQSIFRGEKVFQKAFFIFFFCDNKWLMQPPGCGIKQRFTEETSIMAHSKFVFSFKNYLTTKRISIWSY